MYEILWHDLGGLTKGFDTYIVEQDNKPSVESATETIATEYDIPAKRVRIDAIVEA